MYDLIQLIGWAGAIALLAAYGLLTAGRLKPRSGVYLGLNLAGAATLGLSTAAAHAWPSAAVNVVWLAIGIAPLLRGRSRRSAQRLAEVREQIGDVLDSDREPDEVFAHL